MLTSRSAPQPLIMKTPSGGTGGLCQDFVAREKVVSEWVRQNSQMRVMRTRRMAGTASDMVIRTLVFQRGDDAFEFCWRLSGKDSTS
jgi:hypothetical protein